MRTTIASGRVEDDLLEVRRQDAGQDRGAEHDRDGDRGHEDDLAPARLAADAAAAQPRSASAGIPIGATRTLPACAAPRLVSSPVFGRWKVTVRSASTAGSDGSPLEQVDRGRGVDRDDRDAGRAGPPDDLDRRADRLAQGAADARAQQRVDDDRGLVDAQAEHRHVPGDRSVDLDDPGVARDPVPVPGRRRAGRVGRPAATTATTTEAPARARRRAAT